MLGTGLNVRLTSNGASYTGAASGPELLTVLFHEDGSVDDDTLSITAEPAARVGNRHAWNVGTDEIISGKIVPDATPNMIIGDAAADRAKTAKRFHACGVQAVSDFKSFRFGTSSHLDNDYRWFLADFEAGVYIHDGTPTLRSIMEGNVTQSNLLWSDAGISNNDYFEFALLERGLVGTVGFYRINATGPFQTLMLEDRSDRPGKLNCHNEGAVGMEIDYLITADSDFELPLLVNDSMGTSIGSSDGLGAVESTGGGVTSTAVGNVEISGGKLQMSADGTGFLMYDAGTNHTVQQAKITMNGAVPGGMLIRYQDIFNFMYCIIDPATNMLELYEVVSGGGAVLIASQDFSSEITITTPHEETITVYNKPGLVEITSYPGSLHFVHLRHPTTRFDSATQCGVRVERVAGVSSTAVDFVGTKGEHSLPDFIGA